MHLQKGHGLLLRTRTARFELSACHSIVPFRLTHLPRVQRIGSHVSRSEDLTTARLFDSTSTQRLRLTVDHRHSLYDFRG